MFTRSLNTGSIFLWGIFMAFTLPTFNLLANIWRNGNPTTNPPDVIANVNLCRGERAAIAQPIDVTLPNTWGEMWLLLPAGTDIRDGKAVAGADTCEVPAGSGRFYAVQWVDDAGSGFSNEHRFAAILAINPWPTPFPSGGSTPPIAPLIFIGGNQDSGPVSSILMSYNVPATVLYAVVFISDTIVPVPVLTSAAVGVIAATQFGPSITVGGQFGVMALYIWPHPGGADTLTLTEATATNFGGMIKVFEGFGLTLDVAGTNSGASNAMPLVTPGPTTGAGDLAVGAFIVVPTAGPYSTPGPWSDFTIGGGSAVVIAGQQYDLVVIASIVAPGVVSVTEGQNLGFSSPWIGFIVCTM